MDNPVERPHWNRLQVLLWICTRSSDAVRLAAHDLGSTSLLDFDENDPSHFGDEDELVGTAIINYGYIMSFGDAKRELIVAESKGQLRAYQDSGGAAFFERTGAMAIWPPGDMIESAEVEEPGKLCAEPAEPLHMDLPSHMVSWQHRRLFLPVDRSQKRPSVTGSAPTVTRSGPSAKDGPRPRKSSGVRSAEPATAKRGYKSLRNLG